MRKTTQERQAGNHNKKGKQYQDKRTQERERERIRRETVRKETYVDWKYDKKGWHISWLNQQQREITQASIIIDHQKYTKKHDKSINRNGATKGSRLGNMKRKQRKGRHISWLNQRHREMTQASSSIRRRAANTARHATSRSLFKPKESRPRK